MVQELKFWCLKAATILVMLTGVAQAQNTPRINGVSGQPVYFRIKSEVYLDELEISEGHRERIHQIDLKLHEECRAIEQTDRKPLQIAALIDNAIFEIVTNVLSPEQNIRFVQLVHQDELRRLGGTLSNYLLHPEIQNSMKITGREREKLEKIKSHSVERIRKSAEKFRKRAGETLSKDEAHVKLLLEPEQREKLRKYLGERSRLSPEGTESRFYLNPVFQSNSRGFDNQHTFTLLNSFAHQYYLDDLEIVDAQRKKIKDALATYMSQRREIFATLERDERSKAIRELETQSFKKIYDDVLIDDQRIRFAQLVNRSELMNQGGLVSNYVSQDQISKLMGITGSQKRDLKTQREETLADLLALAESYRSEVPVILEEERKETLEALSPTRQQEVSNLIGARSLVPKHSQPEEFFYLYQILREKKKSIND